MKYSRRIRCKNCGKGNTIMVEQGESVEEYLENNSVVCRNCKCSVGYMIELD